MKYHHYVQRGPNAGRILQVVDYPECLEMLPAQAGETDETHYVAWTATDAAGRPLDPVVTPRRRLVPAVFEEDGLTTITVEADRPLVVQVNGKAQPPEAPVNGVVTLEIDCRVPRMFRIEIDHVDCYLPRTEIRVR